MRFSLQPALLFCLLARLAAAQPAPACMCDYTVSKSGLYTNSNLKVGPGKTVCIQAGHYDFLRFNGFVGAPGQPIRFINCGGQVSVGVDAYYSGIQFNASRYFILSGSGDAGYQYGFRLDQSHQGSSGVSIGGLSSNCEVERVEVATAGFAGMMVKTDPSCDATTWRENFTMYDVRLHDNYIHDTGGEGLYVGNSFYNGVTVTCNGTTQTVYPHLIYGLDMHDNRIERTGAEGLQYGCAPDARVHHNRIDYAGVSPFANYQNNGLQISSGSGGDCYANTISHVTGTALMILGHLGNDLIYNNVIYDAGLDGIFCDDRPGSLANTYMVFAQNTITKTARDGIRLYNGNNTNTVANNVITAVNSTTSLRGKALVFQQGATASVTSNFTALSAATAGFVNDSTDFSLRPGSPLIDAGTSLSSWGIVDDLAGNARNQTYDIGAYEFTTSAAPSAGRQAPLTRVEARATQTGTPIELTPSAPAADKAGDSRSAAIVYPSPTHNQVTIQLPSGQSISQVSFYNLKGLTVLQHVGSGDLPGSLTVTIEYLPAGHYFIDVLTKELHVIRLKFIKI